MPRAMQLSASTLSIFQECPRCFWLHMREGLKRPARPFPSIAGGLDRLIQHWCDDWRPSVPPLLCYAQGAPHGMPGWHLAIPKISYLAVHRALGSVPLIGHLDECLVVPTGEHAVLDHKSRASRPAPGYSALYYQLQMDIYALLLHHAGYHVAPKAYLAYYSPAQDAVIGGSSGPEEGFPFVCTVEALPVAPARAEAAYHAACACLAGGCPPSSTECAYCGYVEERRI